MVQPLGAAGIASPWRFRPRPGGPATRSASQAASEAIARDLLRAVRRKTASYEQLVIGVSGQTRTS